MQQLSNMEGKFVVFMLLFCAVAVIGKSIMEDYGISIFLYSYFSQDQFFFIGIRLGVFFFL